MCKVKTVTVKKHSLLFLCKTQKPQPRKVKAVTKKVKTSKHQLRKWFSDQFWAEHETGFFVKSAKF